jgi:hypothetical protein
MPSPDAARPGSVRLAVILLRVIAVGYLLDAVFLLAGVGGFADDVTNRLAASDVDQSIIPNMRPFASRTAVVSGLVVLVAGIVLLIVSRGVSRGSQAARVITWVAAGLALSCNVCAFGSSGWPGFAGVGFVTARSVDANGTFHTFAERVPDGYPLAYRIFSTTVAVAAMVGLVLVIVLLARKPVHNYFRPAPPMPRWLPMQPYPGMPYPPPDAARRRLPRSHTGSRLSAGDDARCSAHDDAGLSTGDDVRRRRRLPRSPAGAVRTGHRRAPLTTGRAESAEGARRDHRGGVSSRAPRNRGAVGVTAQSRR